ncbi:hypothetical protein K7X08_015039 [Anisodus acutangulus]|uniref:Uncharacterized protein n=1 Tax=Anisodus acutangulus TaxID=402998 RepID=A0A9Q1L314_9SOLA|nr:hypothetical protein K7X08_015039 [Anisodus acutangulus]
MARKRVAPTNPPPQKSLVTTTPKDIPVAPPEESNRMVTPDTEITQPLATTQFTQWLPGRSSTSKIQQAPIKMMTHRPQESQSMVTPTLTPIDDNVAAQAARKLTYSVVNKASAEAKKKEAAKEGISSDKQKDKEDPKGKGRKQNQTQWQAKDSTHVTGTSQDVIQTTTPTQLQ